MLTGRGGGAGGNGLFSARPCHSRNAPVSSRKQEAAPARKRIIRNLPSKREIRHAHLLCRAGAYVNFGSRPLSRWRSIAPARAGEPSISNGSPRRRSRTASAANIDKGRSDAGNRVPKSRLANICAWPNSVDRDAESLQARATSTIAHRPPASSISSLVCARSWAPAANSNRPRNQIASLVATSHGKGSNRLSHPRSSRASSLPRTLLGNNSAATALRRGSAGGPTPRSSSSSRSRHQARRIAPTCGSVVVRTTSPIAASMANKASMAGRASGER